MTRNRLPGEALTGSPLAGLLRPAAITKNIVQQQENRLIQHLVKCLSQYIRLEETCRKMEEKPMNQKLMSDVVGLAKMVPPLSRRGFMSTSAAAAAGYTLAAGPVRADVITTDTNGLTVGDAKVKVAGGDMPVYFAKPANVA